RDLWKVSKWVGTVVRCVSFLTRDLKQGRVFAFVRFIKVLNFDRLIENLKTIWIGRFHLSANPARFERPKAPIPQKKMSAPSGIASGLKQPIAQHQGGPKGTNFAAILKPSLVLDDSCLVNRDLTNCVMGEVLQFSSINNLQGDLVLNESKLKFMEHVGVASWFRSLGNAQSDFAAKERIVWVDIKGVPLNALDSFNFSKDWPYGEHPGKFQAYRKREGDNGEDQVSIIISEPSKLRSLQSVQPTSKSARRNSSPCQSIGLSSRVMEDTVPADVYSSPVGSKPIHGSHKGGSLLEVLDGMIKLGRKIRITWSHPSAAKMSKLDRFLVSEGFLSLFPHISALCLDKNLSDHRPILLREMVTDYGATPFRLYHSWFSFHGFDDMVRTAWNSFVLEDSNGMVRFKKKLQMLKKEIRSWVAVHKRKQSGRLIDIQEKLSGIDHILDQGGVSDEILLSRMELTKQMQDIKSTVVRDQMQKAKIQWAVEGDENSKFFHGIVNRIASVLVNGSPTSEFQFHCGLKQGDPLAPYLFILVMESLHLSVSITVEAGIFTDDRWAWDLNGGGDFCVKDARDLVDEVLLPKENVATRWIKTIPIKEDTSHLFFSCDVALAISRLICRWWNVS
ncbi:RNA-directed DNA polymerase, eukaryota, partial [Tanacetum coccineum]